MNLLRRIGEAVSRRLERSCRSCGKREHLNRGLCSVCADWYREAYQRAVDESTR